jgi:hypothetical protein
MKQKGDQQVVQELGFEVVEWINKQ